MRSRTKTPVLWLSGGLVAGTVVLVILATSGALAGGSSKAAVSNRPTPSEALSTPTATPIPTSGTQQPATQRFDIDSPSSITVVVNKQRPLQPRDYEPSDLVDVDVPHTWAPKLRAVAAAAVVEMFAAAKAEAGLTLASNSAYRSYSSQQSIYDGNDALTARPGYSEHQTGLAIDIGASSGRCSLASCFADTPEGEWLAANAYRFGFILRYPKGLEGVTGYEFEPWHYRYVGTEVAADMRERKVPTLEDYFGLPAAPSY